MAFKVSIIGKTLGILLLAAMIGLSVFAGSDDHATASVVSSLQIPHTENVQTDSTKVVQSVGAPEITEKSITISVLDNGLTILADVKASTVEEALEELHISLNEADVISPNKDAEIAHGGSILISRARKLVVIADGETIHAESNAKTVGDLLEEMEVSFSDDDKVKPNTEAPLPENGTISITRVTTEEETEEREVPFKTIVTRDSNLEKGKSVVDQEGKDGTRVLTYAITYENGEAVDQELVDDVTTEAPQTREVRKGTKVAPPPSPPSSGTPTGNVAQGRATYYWGPTAAASSTLPRGTRVRVTNTNNGKTLDVTIDDSGGFSYPTIIDLRSDLFSQLSPLSSGVFPVKVEVLN